MSDTLTKAQAFSVAIAESHEKVGRNGQKTPYTLTREVVVRRPDRLWSHATGSDERNITATYDGKTVTLEIDLPRTLADEALREVRRELSGGADEDEKAAPRSRQEKPKAKAPASDKRRRVEVR